MRSIGIIGAAAALAVTLTACSTPGAPAATSSPPAGQAASVPAGQAPTDAAARAATTLDPCELVTAEEASKLAGRKFGAGKKNTVPGGETWCVYGDPPANTVTVGVVQASSVEEAQAKKAEILAQAKEQYTGITYTLTAVPGLGDDARWLSGGGSTGGYTVKLDGLYVLRGTVGFAITDIGVNSAVATKAAMIAQANTVIGRLP